MVTFARSAHDGTPMQELIPRHGNSMGRRPNPKNLLDSVGNRIDFDYISSLAGSSVVSADQFDRRMVGELCKFASLLEITEIASHHPLDGKLVVTAFFEASTRTRLSFEGAVLRLDGKIVSVPDGRVTGVAKGESLSDIGEMLNTYGDLVVLRHPEVSAVDEIRRNLLLPLVNAGNGSGEHPTQALIDWYALLKFRPDLLRDDLSDDLRIHVGIIGTPGSMRAVKSFLRMALRFENAVKQVTIISEMADALGESLAEEVEHSAVPVNTTNSLETVLPTLDVIYMNSIALIGGSYRNLDSRYKLTRNSDLKPGAVVMHPFARNNELDTSLDDTPANLYFAQAAGGVYMRQALLTAILDRISRLPPSLRLLTT